MMTARWMEDCRRPVENNGSPVILFRTIAKQMDGEMRPVMVVSADRSVGCMGDPDRVRARQGTKPLLVTPKIALKVHRHRLEHLVRAQKNHPTVLVTETFGLCNTARPPADTNLIFQVSTEVDVFHLLRPLLALLVLFAAPAAAAVGQPQYRITVAADANRRFHVQADLPVSGTELFMQEDMSQPLPNGFADFVENLRATDSRGRAVALTNLGRARWRIARPVKTVRLDYDVVLKHEKVKWDVSGIFARGYAVDDAIFFFGYTAFIRGNPDPVLPARIRFRVPKGWEVATAWSELKGSPGTFVARDWNDLRHTGVLMGRLSKREVRAGAIDVVFAAPRGIAASVDLLGDAIGPIMQGYVRDFGGSPEGRFAYFFSADPTAVTAGAETSHNTISMLLQKPLTLSNKSVWGYILAHELHHLWNGLAINPARTEEVEWFHEGFSVYGATLGLYQSGLNSEDEFLKDLASGYDTYLASAGKVSFKEAGQNKGANNPYIYHGGMVLALAIDLEATGRPGDPQAGFLKMMRLAYDEFGRSGREYTYEDLVRLAGQSTGKDMAGFFARYVEGKELLPLPDYLKRAGLIVSKVNGKTRITRDPSRPPPSSALPPSERG